MHSPKLLVKVCDLFTVNKNVVYQPLLQLNLEVPTKMIRPAVFKQTKK